MPLIRRLWAGDVPLGQTFWWYAVAVGVPLNLIFSLVFLALVSIDGSPVLLGIASVITVPYNLLVLVAVWRSAGRHDGSRHHADLARVVATALVVLLTLT